MRLSACKALRRFSTDPPLGSALVLHRIVWVIGIPAIHKFLTAEADADRVDYGAAELIIHVHQAPNTGMARAKDRLVSRE
jgi:hypothetical protein